MTLVVLYLYFITTIKLAFGAFKLNMTTIEWIVMTFCTDIKMKCYHLYDNY